MSVKRDGDTIRIDAPRWPGAEEPYHIKFDVAHTPSGDVWVAISGMAVSLYWGMPPEAARELAAALYEVAARIENKQAEAAVRAKAALAEPKDAVEVMA